MGIKSLTVSALMALGILGAYRWAIGKNAGVL